MYLDIDPFTIKLANGTLAKAKRICQNLTTMSMSPAHANNVTYFSAGGDRQAFQAPTYSIYKKIPT